MKIALAQLNYTIGDVDGNSDKILLEIEKARERNVDLIIFSELAICGYPPLDLLEKNYFIDQVEQSIAKIRQNTQGIAVIIGGVRRNPDRQGKRLFNSAFFIENREVVRIVDKTLLPTYNIFDEDRYFEPNSTFDPIDFKGFRLGITICEDIWDLDEPQLYHISPINELKNKGAEFIINIAASPFHYNHARERLTIFIAQAKKYNLPIINTNAVGAQTELIFDGGSCIINSDGKVLDELPYFVESTKDYIISSNKIEAVDGLYEEENKDDIRLIHDALILGIRDYFGKLGFKKAILGLSGGIDSAVSTVLTVKALGSDNVEVVLMPSKYSSTSSVTDSIKLAGNLGIVHKVVHIQNIVDSFDEALNIYFKDLPTGLAEENIQARTRAVILMAFSNKFGNILINTSNKSEIAVGYSTLYGDLCGGLSILGDVYKTQVYKLAQYINKESGIIPEMIITKPPSAELRPDQRDTDSLPEYTLLDSILFHYIEEKKGEKEIVELGYNTETVNKIIGMVNASEYKRFQAPPVIRVSPKAFGPGRRIPIVGKF